MDTKKRNIFLFCAAILIASYFARSFVTGYLRMAYMQQQAMRRQQQPKPAPTPSLRPKFRPSRRWEISPASGRGMEGFRADAASAISASS